MVNASPQQKDSDAVQTNAKDIRGKSFEAWVKQAKTSNSITDRHLALQVLRNDGLAHDRATTLSLFAECLQDERPTIRSLAAAGLMKAGRPATAEGLDALRLLLKRDLSKLRPPTGQRSPDTDEIDFPAREIRALGELGEKEDLTILESIAKNNANHELLRVLATQARRKIEAHLKREAMDCDVGRASR